MIRGSRLALVVALAGVAHAQAPNDADVAFKKGRELLKAGKFAEACTEFEKSEGLDPQLGTRFNIAQCTEKQGKLAAALQLYRRLIETETNATRKQVEIEAVAALEKRVPHVLVHVEPRPAGFAVSVAGHPVPCEADPCEARVDAGRIHATAGASGFADTSADVDVAEGETVTVKLTLLPGPQVPPGIPTPIVGNPEPSRSHRKLYASVAIGAGGAAIAGGIVFGLLAHGNWNDAKAACGGTSECPDAASLARANSLRDSANTKATLATVFFIGGAVIAGAGIVLYVTAPSSEHAVAISPTGTGISLSGRF